MVLLSKFFSMEVNTDVKVYQMSQMFSLFFLLFGRIDCCGCKLLF